MASSSSRKSETPQIVDAAFKITAGIVGLLYDFLHYVIVNICIQGSRFLHLRDAIQGFILMLRFPHLNGHGPVNQ